MNWIDEKVGAFEEEFGIHLTKSAGELGFAKDFLSTALEEAHKKGTEEELERVVKLIKGELVDEDGASNDTTSDFIAHDAYTSKAEAFFFGYNQALEDLLLHLQQLKDNIKTV